MKRGKAKTAPHDYRRHRNTTLFTAIELLTGNVVHAATSASGLTFLRRIDDEMPAESDLRRI